MPSSSAAGNAVQRTSRRVLPWIGGPSLSSSPGLMWNCQTLYRMTAVTGGAPVESDQLYLPKGESVQFRLHSKDVIHAFWIPAFRLQEDVVPGITVQYRATPDRLGTYPIVCNLLCGIGHSLMRSAVHVIPPAQFQAWIQSRLRAAGQGAGASPSATVAGAPSSTSTAGAASK